MRSTIPCLDRHQAPSATVTFAAPFGDRGIGTIPDTATSPGSIAKLSFERILNFKLADFPQDWHSLGPRQPSGASECFFPCFARAAAHVMASGVGIGTCR